VLGPALAAGGALPTDMFNVDAQPFTLYLTNVVPAVVEAVNKPVVALITPEVVGKLLQLPPESVLV
jgi:hypothetical protein